MANKNEEKLQNLTLWGYYAGLPKSSFPKKEFVARIMKECDVSFTTARNWIHGHTRPKTEEKLETLSRICGIPKERLWQ